ncbi:FAD-dependent catabolic D-arginine dehydrogenase DauA [soil metagenome]
MTTQTDIIVIGAGIAGASAAAHLSQTRKVIVLEMEERPGYHTTGRSAATFEPNYGPAPIRALTRASRDFFRSPPDGFAAAPLIEDRESMLFVSAGQEEIGRKALADGAGLVEISEAEARKRFPVLKSGYAKNILLDPHSAFLDVDLLHQGFLRLFKSRGGQVVCNAEVTGIHRHGDHWHVTTPAGDFVAPVVVNAAGAWSDVIAELAGAARAGLQPKRRSIAVVPLPQGMNSRDWPMITDVGETWYAKPQGSRLLISPADATHVEPHDAFADDLLLAEGIDRFQQAADVAIERIEHSWGGLRTFAPDGSPVCGYDPEMPGFFWLAGQGGYGIQTSPALSRLAAALVLEQPVPADIAAEGITAETLSPSRFKRFEARSARTSA